MFMKWSVLMMMLATLWVVRAGLLVALVALLMAVARLRQPIAGGTTAQPMALYSPA
jgi:hypothetical protein